MSETDCFIYWLSLIGNYDKSWGIEMGWLDCRYCSNIAPGCAPFCRNYPSSGLLTIFSGMCGARQNLYRKVAWNCTYCCYYNCFHQDIVMCAKRSEFLFTLLSKFPIDIYVFHVPCKNYIVLNAIKRNEPPWENINTYNMT